MPLSIYDINDSAAALIKDKLQNTNVLTFPLICNNWKNFKLRFPFKSLIHRIRPIRF